MPPMWGANGDVDVVVMYIFVESRALCIWYGIYKKDQMVFIYTKRTRPIYYPSKMNLLRIILEHLRYFVSSAFSQNHLNLIYIRGNSLLSKNVITKSINRQIYIGITRIHSFNRYLRNHSWVRQFHYGISNRSTRNRTHIQTYLLYHEKCGNRGVLYAKRHLLLFRVYRTNESNQFVT